MVSPIYRGKIYLRGWVTQFSSYLTRKNPKKSVFSASGSSNHLSSQSGNILPLTQPVTHSLQPGEKTEPWIVILHLEFPKLFMSQGNVNSWGCADHSLVQFCFSPGPKSILKKKKIKKFFFHSSPLWGHYKTLLPHKCWAPQFLFNTHANVFNICINPKLFFKGYQHSKVSQF